MRATTQENEQVVEGAQANSFANISAYFERILEGLFIDRMDGNEEIFRRVMSDKQFRDIAPAHLAPEPYERILQAKVENPS